MTPLDWKQRKQWVTHIGHSGIDVEVTITRSLSEVTWYWHVDGFDRSRMTSHDEFCAAPAWSLTEAKRRSAQQADALLVRMLNARGGA